MPATGAVLEEIKANPELYLQKKVATFKKDPLGYIKYIYQWGKNELSDYAGPRAWQSDILETIGAHLQNSATRFQPLMIAVSSGHGIGKTALISMVVQWANATCVDCKTVITANTGTQLATKTAPEVAKWFRLAINKHWFDVKATSITCKAPGHERTWRTDFIPWSENNTEAFAGLHNKGKRIVVIFDESSAIAEIVWQVAEGALTDEQTEIIFLAFGNPTKNTGRFRECFGKFKHRWVTKQIDSRTVEGTNKEQIEKWIADYGEDSDFVRVRVRGEFPRAGSSQFIGSDVVAAARRYRAEGFGGLPKVLSVDVARFGDDQTVIGTRQGRKAVILGRYRGKDNVWVAEQTIQLMKECLPQAIVIDGDGNGGGVVDQIKSRGFGDKVFEFHGGASAHDSDMYYNRRTEVWGLMRQWLQNGAEIPDDPELDDDLTGPEFGFANGKRNAGALQLEMKDDMKKRGLSSPDCGDMLAMTFGVTVAPPEPKPEVEYQYPGERSLSWMGG